jgi:ketosteroid isomerase-like protein
MSRAEEPTRNDSAQVHALVNRQVQAWEKRDFAIAADDWLPNGELFSPGGHVVKKDMQSAILDYFKSFTDLKVTVNEMFLSEDGTRLAIQWDWAVTRKRNRKRATTHDAILVHLVGGKIATWNEYFGLATIWPEPIPPAPGASASPSHWAVRRASSRTF